MENTKIEWATHTFNPWIGCTKVSPGCANCYAEALNKRWKGGENWGKGAPRSRTSPSNWKKPLKWNREAPSFCDGCETQYSPGGYPENFKSYCTCGGTIALHRTRVFCASLADWLDDEVPIEWLADLLELIHATPALDWLLLTKRPENWEDRVAAATEHMHPEGNIASEWLSGRFPSNVWIGTTAEDQTRADQRIPKLLEIPARIRFLSCEPLLGPLELMTYLDPIDGGYVGKSFIDWIIAGGESGHGARPMPSEWVRELREQCAEAGVPFFFKQWGEWIDAGHPEFGQLPKSELAWIDSAGKFIPPAGNENADCLTVRRIGKGRAGRLLDGREHSEFPK